MSWSAVVGVGPQSAAQVEPNTFWSSSCRLRWTHRRRSRYFHQETRRQAEVANARSVGTPEWCVGTVVLDAAERGDREEAGVGRSAGLHVGYGAAEPPRDSVDRHDDLFDVRAEVGDVGEGERLRRAGAE